jgi:thiamine biosynthesis lipoprotein
MALEATAATRRPTLREHRFRSMGCDVRVLAPSDRSDSAFAVRQILEEWDARFSRFRGDSELEALNDAGGRPFPVSDLMMSVLCTALDAARATDGLFDPTLGGRMIQLGYDRTYEELPARGSDTALPNWRAGAWREILVDPERSTVQVPLGFRIDLGGIAKGMAVDAALAALVADGVQYAAVNAGGDLAVAGLPPGQESWSVAIDGPRETVVAVRQGALATSSVLRRRWQVNGEGRHHLLDPRTGLPSTGPIAQASVAAATCALAEVAAKMAVLSDLPGAIGGLERYRLAALLFTSQGESWRVGAWT